MDKAQKIKSVKVFEKDKKSIWGVWLFGIA